VRTAGDYGLTWDEPAYIESADRLADWFSGVAHGRILEAFRGDRIREAWVFARRENRNLPVPVLLSLVGHALARGLSPPASYRVGACALMAGTSALLLWSLGRRRGVPTGIAAAALLLLDPPFFAHAHIAATDTPVSCLFLLALLLWGESGTRPRCLWAAALVCGLGFASKASFALLPAVLLAWLVLFGDRAAWIRAGRLALVVPFLTLLFCPMWWAHPIDGPLAYLTRVAQAGERWHVDAYYLGRASTEKLPWHSGFVLAAATTPPVTLGLAVLGGLLGASRRDAEAVLWTIGALALPLARLLPSAPAHDAARLLLPSLYCLVPLAALGLAEARRLLPGRILGPLLWVAALGLPARAILELHPYEMSYYSEALGGLAGADRLGFEVTYWFDAFTPQAREAVQALLPEGARVRTAPRYTGYPLLREWGQWRRDLQDDDERPQFLILYGRKGYYTQIPELAAIAERATPLWALRVQGVALVRLYRGEGETLLSR
jgi:4-amino-4-deoxy-L-arabinose transferase-like glycosyltransferase